MSSQVVPLAWGASPGQRRMVWIFRKALSLPAVAQVVSCACGGGAGKEGDGKEGK